MIKGKVGIKTKKQDNARLRDMKSGVVPWKESTKSDKYKGVFLWVKGIKQKYAGHVKGKFKFFETEREAALFVDTERISIGQCPVNILKTQINKHQ